jgi:hypothetical protein
LLGKGYQLRSINLLGIDLNITCDGSRYLEAPDVCVSIVEL